MVYEVLIQSASAAACSDIESDDELTRREGRETWAVSHMPWRNPKLSMLYHFLDALYESRQEKTKIYKRTAQAIHRKTPKRYTDIDSKRGPPLRRLKTIYDPAFLTQAEQDGDLPYMRVGPDYNVALPEPQDYDRLATNKPGGILAKRWNEHKMECTTCATAFEQVQQQDDPED